MVIDATPPVDWAIGKMAEFENEKGIHIMEEDEDFISATCPVVEAKSFSFFADEVKSVERDGIQYGIISGYASTFGNVDRVNDMVMQGAFGATIKEYQEKRRPIRMYYQHDDKEVIGAFSAFSMREDEKGLYVQGEINLEVQRGREVYALAKQGVLTDLSIGYTVRDFDMDRGVRKLKSLALWEISVVAEPANPLATITSVKSVEDVKSTIKKKSDFERILREVGFSRSSAKYMASLIDQKKLDSSDSPEESTESLLEDSDTKNIQQSDVVAPLCDEGSESNVLEEKLMTSLDNESIVDAAEPELEEVKAVVEIEINVGEDLSEDEMPVEAATAVGEPNEAPTTQEEESTAPDPREVLLALRELLNRL